MESGRENCIHAKHSPQRDMNIIIFNRPVINAPKSLEKKNHITQSKTV